MNKNWLITGGCGFIGRNLIAYLLKNYADINIRVLDNLSVGSKDDLGSVCDFKMEEIDNVSAPFKGVVLVQGDIRNPQDCFNSAKGIDTVVHLAANTGVQPSMDNPRLDLESNVLGVFNMLEAARQHKVHKFIFASSGAPLGEVTPPINEEIVAKPISPYGASKLAGEAYCQVYGKSFGLKTVVFRFGNVYGPRSGHKASIVAKFFKNAYNKMPLEIYGDGNQTRDFVYVEDLLEAFILADKADVAGEIFQIATYRETTVNEIANLIKKILKEHEGIDVEIIHTQERVGDMKRNFSDISKARRILGFEPRHDIAQGLLKTYSFFKSRHANHEATRIS